MKKALVLIALASTTAWAAPAQKPFVGRFKVDTANCSLSGSYYADASRVYISAKPSAWGPKGAVALEIKFYGDDASQLEVLLGMGSRTAPGSSDAVQQWQTVVQGNTLKSVELTTRAATRYRAQETTTMVDHGQTLEFERVYQEAGKSAQREYCRFFRY